MRESRPPETRQPTMREHLVSLVECIVETLIEKTHLDELDVGELENRKNVFRRRIDHQRSIPMTNVMSSVLNETRRAVAFATSSSESFSPAPRSSCATWPAYTDESSAELTGLAKRST